MVANCSARAIAEPVVVNRVVALELDRLNSIRVILSSPSTSMRNSSPDVISTGVRPDRHTAQRPDGCRRRIPSFSVIVMLGSTHLAGHALEYKPPPGSAPI